MKVKFLGMDERGKVRLSMKVVDQETGEDITEKLKAQREAERAQRDQQRRRGSNRLSDFPRGAILRVAPFFVATVYAIFGAWREVSKTF